MIRGPRLVLPLAVGILAACAGEPPAPGLANGSFTAELDGVRIHYAVHGTGPVLMTVPNSWGLSHEGLRAMYRPLEERLTVVYFDPRGMGGSGPVREESDRGMAAVRADFHALREHLGLETVHAIGWSNGAANLIYLAHERPEALASAIFVHGGASFTAEDGEWIEREHPDLMRAFGEFTADVATNPGLSVEEKTAGLRALWLETYFPRIAADPAAARPLLARTFADAEFSWPHADYTQRTMPGFDARDLLPDIPVRSLVTAGAHDLLPPDRIRPLADGLPDAELLVFEASGHFAPIEEPDAFRDAVFRFLGVDGQEAGGDEAAIRGLIAESYVTGVFVARDEAAVRRGFHPAFVLSVRQADSVLVVSLDAWLERLRLDDVPSPRSYRHTIDRVEVTGNTAAVRLRIFQDDRQIYTDFFNLYQFPDGWRIVSKVFEPHA